MDLQVELALLADPYDPITCILATAANTNLRSFAKLLHAAASGLLFWGFTRNEPRFEPTPTRCTFDLRSQAISTVDSRSGITCALLQHGTVVLLLTGSPRSPFYPIYGAARPRASISESTWLLGHTGEDDIGPPSTTLQDTSIVVFDNGCKHRAIPLSALESLSM